MSCPGPEIYFTHHHMVLFIILYLNFKVRNWGWGGMGAIGNLMGSNIGPCYYPEKSLNIYFNIIEQLRVIIAY